MSAARCCTCGRAEDKTLNARGTWTVELRPYGPNGKPICFECAMKDDPALRQRFAERMRRAENAGEGVVVVGDGPVRPATYQEQRAARRSPKGGAR